jgi:hypothetical protein
MLAGVPPHTASGGGVHPADVTGDERQHLAPLLVNAERKRRAGA